MFAGVDIPLQIFIAIPASVIISITSISIDRLFRPRATYLELYKAYKEEANEVTDILEKKNYQDISKHSLLKENSAKQKIPILKAFFLKQKNHQKKIKRIDAD